MLKHEELLLFVQRKRQFFNNTNKLKKVLMWFVSVVGFIEKGNSLEIHTINRLKKTADVSPCQKIGKICRRLLL